MNETIKVTHILDHFIPHYSGYTFRTKSILDHQRLLGLKPSVLISSKHSEGLPKHEIIDGMDCFRSAPLNGALDIPFLREYCLIKLFRRDILNNITNNRPDIIHAHSPILNGIPAYDVAKKLSIPMIYEVRALWEDAAVDIGHTKEKSLRYKLTHYLETSLLKKVGAIITICDGLKNEFIRRGINPDKIYVISNGVDTQRFLPQPPNQKLVSQYKLEDKKVIGFIGSFYQYEGLAYLIQALPKILSQANNVILMLIGQGTQEQTLKELVNKMGLSNNVIFTGQVPHAQILDYYSIIDIFAYPRESNRLTELTTPLKPLEAMAMEKAVIGSNIGGIKELIRDRKTGLLFKAKDISDLADKCIELIKNVELRKFLGLNGRQYVLEHRNWEKIISKHLDIYDNLIKHKK